MLGKERCRETEGKGGLLVTAKKRSLLLSYTLNGKRPQRQESKRYN